MMFIEVPKVMMFWPGVALIAAIIIGRDVYAPVFLGGPQLRLGTMHRALTESLRQARLARALAEPADGPVARAIDAAIATLAPALEAAAAPAAIAALAPVLEAAAPIPPAPAPPAVTISPHTAAAIARTFKFVGDCGRGYVWASGQWAPLTTAERRAALPALRAAITPAEPAHLAPFFHYVFHGMNHNIRFANYTEDDFEAVFAPLALIAERAAETDTAWYEQSIQDLFADVIVQDWDLELLQRQDVEDAGRRRRMASAFRKAAHILALILTALGPFGVHDALTSTLSKCFSTSAPCVRELAECARSRVTPAAWDAAAAAMRPRAAHVLARCIADEAAAPTEQSRDRTRLARDMAALVGLV